MMVSFPEMTTWSGFPRQITLLPLTPKWAAAERSLWSLNVTGIQVNHVIGRSRSSEIMSVLSAPLLQFFALHQLAKSRGEFAPGEVRHVRLTNLRQNSSHNITMIRNLNLSIMNRVTHPRTGLLMQFTNTNCFHMTHRVTNDRIYQDGAGPVLPPPFVAKTTQIS